MTSDAESHIASRSLEAAVSDSACSTPVSLCARQTVPCSHMTCRWDQGIQLLGAAKVANPAWQEACFPPLHVLQQAAQLRESLFVIDRAGQHLLCESEWCPSWQSAQAPCPTSASTALAPGIDLPAVRAVETLACRRLWTQHQYGSRSTNHLAQHGKIMCACHWQNSPRVFLKSNLLFRGTSTSMATQVVGATYGSGMQSARPNTSSSTSFLLGVTANLLQGTANLLKLQHHTTDTVQCANLGLPSKLWGTMRSNSHPLTGHQSQSAPDWSVIRLCMF